jgi:hypothetical protein
MPRATNYASLSPAGRRAVFNDRSPQASSGMSSPRARRLAARSRCMGERISNACKRCRLRVRFSKKSFKPHTDACPLSGGPAGICFWPPPCAYHCGRQVSQPPGPRAPQQAALRRPRARRALGATRYSANEIKRATPYEPRPGVAPRMNELIARTRDDFEVAG